MEDTVLWFDQVGMNNVDQVGGKNASLGEMYQNLTQQGVRIPNGFALTADAYFHILEYNNVQEEIHELLQDLDTNDMDELQERGRRVRAIIRNLTFPDTITNELNQAYNNLSNAYETNNVDVAVRSSATAEDLPSASFAGQQDTYLNVKGEQELLEACKKCYASLFTNRAISYREDQGFDHFKIGLSVGVQKMVRSDTASAGVMFSIDTETGFEDVVFITGAWGLGENVVKGAVNPDEYYVFKPTLQDGYKPIISKQLGNKAIKRVYDLDSSEAGTKDKTVSPERQNQYVLTDEEILTLARWACKIEDYYSQQKGETVPMDIEWAKDGTTDELYVVQARPETVHSQAKEYVSKDYNLQEQSQALLQGQAVGERIGTGTVNVLQNAQAIEEFNEGDVLVTDMTDPDWEPIMKQAAAIITNRGGRTCHAAIVSRELGIPCIVGTETATDKLATGTDVTADCSQGEEGIVWKGKLQYEVNETDLTDVPDVPTDIMVNIGNPEQAFKFGQLPHDGVGLAREEFIIMSDIGIHPLALVNYDELNTNVQKQIDERIQNEEPTEYFIDKLAQGIGTIAAAFYPEEVIVRMSDFKSNEYADLIGGETFEPDEENPMLGWRGASRYYSDTYSDAFALECEALKRVRRTFGLDNVTIMIPFVRTVEEGKQVLNALKNNGLEQGKNDLDIIAMCEIPGNIQRAEAFLEIFDGYSIGTNDLTQLTMGIDRDSARVSNIADERNPAVLQQIKDVIEIANEKDKYIGICGQAPSDFSYESFGKYLVEAGISSISLSPDTVVDMHYEIDKHS